MGEAKRRGSRDERVALALAAQAERERKDADARAESERQQRATVRKAITIGAMAALSLGRQSQAASLLRSVRLLRRGTE